MTSKSRTPRSVPQSESALRHFPLVDLLIDTKTELHELWTMSVLCKRSYSCS